MVMSPEIALACMEESVMIAGMRGAFPPATAMTIVEVMLQAGFNVFEFTMNSEQPIAAMQAVKTEFGNEICAGMGTVLNQDHAQQVLDAGADFVVSPAFQPHIVQFYLDHDVLVAPGVITPSEAVNAWDMGVQLLKVFPIGNLGVPYFKSLFGPLNHMRYMCNGGVNDENAYGFLQAGASCIGMSSWLTGDGSWTTAKLRSRAHILRSVVDRIRAEQIEDDE